MSDLFTATRPHDLPPKWDGNPVTWGDWQFAPLLFVCPPPKRPSCCPQCASTAEQPQKHGSYRRGPLRGVVIRTRPGRPGVLCRLVAFRCPDCRHDQVLDSAAGEWWDLDPDDYQNGGSWA